MTQPPPSSFTPASAPAGARASERASRLGPGFGPGADRWYPVELTLAGGVAATLLIAWLLARFHRELQHARVIRLDDSLPALLHAHATPALTHLMFALTWIGSPLQVVAILLVTLAVLLLRRRRGEAIGVLASEIGAVALNQITKAVFQRERPDWTWLLVHERNYSFPSGHAMMGIISFGTIAFLLCRWFAGRAARAGIVTIAAALIVGIGLSRVYLGAHFPSDIIAGWLAGGVWLLTVIALTILLHRAAPELRPPPNQVQGQAS